MSVSRPEEYDGPIIPCSLRECTGIIERIERYKTTVVWERGQSGAWETGTLDEGTHFHLFCSQGHEQKRWGRDLPANVKAIVFPGEQPIPEPRSRPAVPYGAPRGRKAWEAYIRRMEDER